MKIKYVLALRFLTMATGVVALAQLEIGNSIDALCVPACGTINTSGGLKGMMHLTSCMISRQTGISFPLHSKRGVP